MVVMDAIEGMMASHSLYVSVVDRLIIIMTIVARRLANPIVLQILPQLMLLCLHLQL